MATQLAPPRGTIEFKLPEYEARTPFFNMYDSVGTLAPFDPVEIVGYPSHCVELVKADGEDQPHVAEHDDELVLVVQGTIGVTFTEGDRRVASGIAEDGEVLLLPRALTYRIRSEGTEPALYLHMRTRPAPAGA
jgi:mannose-6-phosphate isomerase-like protein (cupin superfamily)